LTNAWRHASGQGQRVRARVEHESIRLEVIDSGPGFDVASMVGKEDHLGLIGIRERVASLGGSFRIESAPEGGDCQVGGTHGTCLIALLPLRSQGEFDA
jgi:signal transduction histidine kinase